MTAWTPARIGQAAAEWVWVPEEADEVRTEHYHLIRYPDWFTHPTVVAWSRTDRELSPLIDAVAEQTRAWGRSAVFWTVSAATRPPDTEAELVRRGATRVETVQVLAREIGEELPDLHPPDDVRTVRVHDEQTLRDATEVAAAVWGDRPPEDLDLGEEVERARRDWDEGTGFRVVAYLDGRPVSTGGVTLAGEVVRLWGACTLPDARHGGAYRAALAERLRLGRARGGTLALVKGRVETSAPILRRAGFAPYGEERTLRLSVE